jgi:ferredoxin
MTIFLQPFFAFRLKRPSSTFQLQARKFPPIRSPEWAKERGLEPGYGGYWPGDPNARTYKVTIRDKKTNIEYTEMVPEDRYIYFVFEEKGIDLPIPNKPRMCRQGCCTTCTVKVTEGKVKMDVPLGLLKEFRREGYALSCCSYPKSDIVCEIQDEDELFIKQWSESFESGGVEWGGFLPDDD